MGQHSKDERDPRGYIRYARHDQRERLRGGIRKESNKAEVISEAERLGEEEHRQERSTAGSAAGVVRAKTKTTEEVKEKGGEWA